MAIAKINSYLSKGKVFALVTVGLLTAGLVAFSSELQLRKLSPFRSEAAANCSLYASPTGNDTNSGTSAISPLTLSGASKRTVPGSVVCLLKGSYLLSRPLYIEKSGNSSAWIVYRAEIPGEAIIKWNSTTSDDMFQLTQRTPGTSYIEISDLVFDGSFNGVNTATNAIHPHIGSHHIKILNNTMRNLKASGVATSESDYNWIIGNKIHHIGNYSTDRNLGWGSGISLNSNFWSDQYSGFHSIIVGNFISGVVDGSSYNTDGNGIIMDTGQGSSSSTPPVLILNNIVYQNGGRCIHNLDVSNIWVVNNTCYGNTLDSRVTGTGEFSFQTATGSYVVNNIAFAWTKGNTYQHSQNAQNIKYSKNIGFGGKGLAGVPTATSNDASQVKVIDPLLVSPPILNVSEDRQYANAINPSQIGNKFYLRANSPAINAGIDPTKLTTDANLKHDLVAYVYKDIEGKPRPQGSNFDLGAYEYQLSSVMSSPTPVDSNIASSSSKGSEITIFAAGTIAKGVYPTMNLLISNQKVASWENVSVDLKNPKYMSYTYRSPSKIDRTQVRIQFVNDASSGGEDRNLYIDKIIIDGVAYQTEASSTYSTGTYSSSGGCTSGFKKSEALHCNGYFQY